MVRIGGDLPPHCDFRGVQTWAAGTTSHLDSKKFKEMTSLRKRQKQGVGTDGGAVAPVVPGLQVGS